MTWLPFGFALNDLWGWNGFVPRHLETFLCLLELNRLRFSET